MLFYIVDDDAATRAMLTEIIEDGDLGVVAGEAHNGATIDEQRLKKVNMLLIDFLMPVKDGMETVLDLKPTFQGKIVMISQIESKELIAQAYTHGIEYYITKPIHKIEVVAVIKKVIERIDLEGSIQTIHALASNILSKHTERKQDTSLAQHFFSCAQYLLSELGIVGESGYKDLLDILAYLFQYDRKKTFKDGLPQLKEIFYHVGKEKQGTAPQPDALPREIKAAEQRTRRTIYHALNHLASLGLNDFTNPIFESYAPKFFDFAIVQERMREMKKGQALPSTSIRVNTKKFIYVLYFESQRLMEVS